MNKLDAFQKEPSPAKRQPFSLEEIVSERIKIGRQNILLWQLAYLSVVAGLSAVLLSPRTSERKQTIAKGALAASTIGIAAADVVHLRRDRRLHQLKDNLTR